MTTFWSSTPLNFKHKDSLLCCLDEINHHFPQELKIVDSCIVGSKFNEQLGKVISGFVWGGFAIKTANKTDVGFNADIRFFSEGGDLSHSVDLADVVNHITPPQIQMVWRVDCSHPIFEGLSTVEVQKQLQSKIDSGELTERGFDLYILNISQGQSTESDQGELMFMSRHFSLTNEYDPQDYYIPLNFRQ